MAKNRDLGKLRVDLELNTVSFAVGAKQAQSSMSQLQKSIQGMAASAVAAVGIGSLGVAMKSAVSSAMELNAGMANIASLMPGNAAQIETFRDAIQDLSISSGKSTTDLSAAMYQVVSAFGGGADAVDRLRIATDASQAGLSTTEESFNLLSVATKAYGQSSVEAMQYVSDLAFKTVQLGQTTYPELAKALQQVASESSTAGVSQKELFATFAATTGVIGNASVVATKLKAALSSMQNPTKDLESVYSQLGVTSGKALIEQKGLQGALVAITGAAESSGVSLGKLLGSTEAQSVAMSIAGQQSEKYKQSLEGMANAAGTTADALKEQKEGINELGSTLSQLAATGVVAMQKFGQAIIDGLQGSGAVSVLQVIKQSLIEIGALFDGKTVLAAKLTTAVDEASKKVQTFEGYIRNLNESLEDTSWASIFTVKSNAEENLKKYNEQLVVAKKELNLANKNLQLWYDTFEKKDKAVPSATEEASKLGEATGQAGKAHIKTAEQISAAAKSAKDAAKAMADLRAKYLDTVTDIKKNKLQDLFSVAIKAEDFRAIEGLGEKFYEETKNGLIEGLDESLKSNEQALAITDNMARALSDDKIKQAYADIEDGLLKGIEKEKEEREKVIKDLAELQIKEQKRVSKITEDFYLDAYSSIASATTGREALQGVLQGGAQAASASTGLPIDTIAQPYIDRYIQIGKDAGKDMNLAIGTVLTMGMLPPNISEAIGEPFRVALFGGTKDAETEARDRVESYLENLLQTNVVFGDEIKTGWADSFAAITGEGQTAFETLGTAISVMSGQSIELGGQIGYVLGENLAGNIDQARMLVQELGLSAEGMGEIFLEAGKKGEITWHEFEVSMQGVNELTQAGLVGVGDLRGAYELLGNKGTRALVALRNFGVEATEAGATSLETLNGVMQKLGFTQVETDRMITALQGRGVASMEDLGTASERTLGGIIADLESSGMQWNTFAEGLVGAVDQMTELQEKLSGIENKTVDINVKLHYSASGDVPTQAYASGDVLKDVMPFASGGVVHRPTYFKHSGGLGVMGEAGSEAIMPLGRNSKGELGVKLSSGGSGDINFQYVINNPGQNSLGAIESAIRSAHKAAVRDSVAAISEARRRGVW